MYPISDYAVALIKYFEGFQPQSYVCAGGYRTIGYGHVLKEGESVSEPISLAYAERLLIQDVTIASHAVLKLIHAPLLPYQFDALTSFTFNLGAGALQRSTIRRKLNREEYDYAVSEFSRWVYAGGRKLSGLVKRRHTEAELFLGNHILPLKGIIDE